MFSGTTAQELISALISFSGTAANVPRFLH